MKVTPKGIGWLIFGVIVCASSTEASGLIPALSTIALGIVFILIYVMKQFFKPRGIGWYIAGGTLVAFSIESGANSDTLIALTIAAACLGIFYYRNRESLDNMLAGIVTDGVYEPDPLEDFSYLDEETYPEPVKETEPDETVVSDATMPDVPSTDSSIQDPDDLSADATEVEYVMSDNE